MWTWADWGRALFGASLGSALGCSVLLGGTPQQCSADSDCNADGRSGLVCVDALCVGDEDASDTAADGSTGTAGASTGEATAGDSEGTDESTGTVIPPGPWGCLEVPPPEKPDAMPGVNHAYGGRVIDTITQMPPEGLAIRVCDALDVECASPLIVDVPFDDMGQYTMDVPSGFEGFIEFTSPSTVPQILWMPGPIVEDSAEVDVPLQLVSPGIVDSLVMSAGYEIDPLKGLVLLVATDCEGGATAGVAYSLDEADDETVLFYLYGLLPELDAGETDQSGFGGFFNAPPGLATVRATHVESSTELSAQRFLIRAGWISSVAAGPAI